MSCGRHKPKQKHWRRRRCPRKQLAQCPDCGAASVAGTLLAFDAFGVFVQCPRCDIGSPIGQWRVIER